MRIRQYCAAGALLALSAAMGAPQAAEQVSIRASSRGSAVEIEARATLRAPYALIWQTLTDYDHLSDFIPGMLKSHVIDRRGNATIIEQSGNATILFFNYPIDVVIESLWSLGNGVYGNARGKPADQRATARRDLQTLIVALEKNLPIAGSGAFDDPFNIRRRDEVALKLRAHIARLR